MNNVLTAVLSEYDALWDGTLFPEILDAEVYDNIGEQFIVGLTQQLCFQIQPDFVARLDRIEALIVSIAVVSALAERCKNELSSLGTDAIFFDGPSEILDAEVYDCLGERFIMNLPEQLCSQIQPDFVARLNRIEALIVSIAVVSALAEPYKNKIFSLGIDAIFFDGPSLNELQFLCIPEVLTPFND